jgi:hypothetical protein
MEILLAAAVKKINDSETLMATGPLLKFMKDVEEHNPKYLESAQELEWIIKRIEKEWDIAMYIQSIQQDCFAFFDEVDDTMHNVILNHEMMPYFPVQCAKIDIEKVDDTTDKVNARLPVIFWSMSPEEQKEIIFDTAVKKIACSKTIRETIPLLRFMKDVEERNPKYLEVIPEILSIFDGELLSLTWDFNYKPKYKNSEEIKIYTEHDPPNRPYKVVLVMLILQNAPHIQIPEWLQTPIQTSKEPLAVKTQDAIEVFKKEASKKGVDAIIVDSTSAELEELEEIINPSTRAESLNWIPGLPGFRHHTKTALFWLCQGIILTNQ